MNDVCETEADEFAAWCRKKYLESGGLIIAVAVMGEKGANVLSVQTTMGLDDTAMVLRMAGDTDNAKDYVPTTTGGNTLQ